MDLRDGIKKFHDGPWSISVDENIVLVVLRPTIERTAGSLYTGGPDQYVVAAEVAEHAARLLQAWVVENSHPEDCWWERNMVGIVDDSFLGCGYKRLRSQNNKGA